MVELEDTTAPILQRVTPVSVFGGGHCLSFFFIRVPLAIRMQVSKSGLSASSCDLVYTSARRWLTRGGQNMLVA